MRRIKVILCCCGSLGLVGLKALLKVSVVEVIAVMTDCHSLEILNLAKTRGIKIIKGNPRIGRIPSLPIFDLLLSVNYVFILPKRILDRARLAAFNIHGSLLPKYMGRTPVTWTIINDEVETGITVHEMVPDVDCGPIIYQEKIEITNDDTGGTLLSKISARYPFILNNVIQKLLKNNISRTPQNLNKRTFFGKRESVDGLIDWRWSARKVYNWVRAQTKPYPGAFGYVNGKKYRFWWVEEVSSMFAPKKRVGSFFKVKGALCIACGQGAVRVVRYDAEDR